VGTGVKIQHAGNYKARIGKEENLETLMTTDDTDIRPDSEIVQESDELLAAFEKVKLAKKNFDSRRRGNRYNNQVPEHNWKSPVKED